MSLDFDMQLFTKLMLEDADRTMRKKASSIAKSEDSVEPKDNSPRVSDEPEDDFSIGSEEPTEEFKEEDFYTDLKEPKEEYFSSVDEAVERMTKNTEDSVKKDYFMNDLNSELKDIMMAYESDIVRLKKKLAYKDTKTDKQSNCRYAYKRKSTVVAGKEMNYTHYKEVPKWESSLLECLNTNDKELNLEQMKAKVTVELLNYFGGSNNIKTIVVQGDQLIINSVLYSPTLSDTVLSRMPFDCADYITNGCLAPFFNWKHLASMQRLSVLSFDNPDFVMQNVGYDLGFGRDFNPLRLFKICSNLQTLEIGEEVVTYPLSNSSKESARAIKDEAQRYKRFDKVYDNYTKYVSNTLGGIRHWSVGNLVNYANSRGSKGFFRYTVGLAGRTVGTAVVGTTELGARAVGGTIKAIASVFKNAVNEASGKDTTY